MGEQVNNRRIAWNAIALTLRMILVTAVGLYTSRVVLSVLGHEDYGIWGVVGGVVAMASFLNTAMAGATSRFITFALGEGNSVKLRSTFSTSLKIHIGIAIAVAILAETVGLWFLNDKMNFPADRMTAVHILYQLTIVEMMVTFTQAPYSGTIIAHEKLKIYAWMESLVALLKLGIVFMLLLTSADRLIFYAVLSCLLKIAVMGVYRVYCVRHFPECHLNRGWDSATFSQMARFSLFDLYGNMGVIAQQQGIPILLNMFFGVIANTASTLTFTVFNSILGFTNAVSQAFRPQIIKQYAGGDYDAMGKLMSRSAQFTILVFSIVAIPVVIETPRVLWLWLGQVPEYSVTFIRLTLIYGFFDIIVRVNNTGIHATGQVRNISFISGSFYLFSPIIAYVLLKWCHWGVNTVYQIEIATIVCVLFIGVALVKIQIPRFSITRYIVANLRTFLAVGVAGAVIAFLVSRGYIAPEIDTTHTFLRNLVFVGESTLATSLILGLSAFIIAFGHDERQFLINQILRRKP